MKIFEFMDSNNSTIHDAIQMMIEEMFGVQLDDSKIDEIADNISLSDVLALDSAFDRDDKEAVQSIIGPLPQLEYNMGGTEPVTSTASSRPTTSGAAKRTPTKSTQGNTSNTSNSRYSGGQNGVNRAQPNTDPEAEIAPEELQESADIITMTAWLKRRAGIA
jgi:hypothetical protein